MNSKQKINDIFAQFFQDYGQQIREIQSQFFGDRFEIKTTVFRMTQSRKIHYFIVERCMSDYLPTLRISTSIEFDELGDRDIPEIILFHQEFHRINPKIKIKDGKIRTISRGTYGIEIWVN